MAHSGERTMAIIRYMRQGLAAKRKIITPTANIVNDAGTGTDVVSVGAAPNSTVQYQDTFINIDCSRSC
ncbi:MAG: hypothetical protein AAGB02_02895 [Pseudomonadota bacterium]